MAADSGITTRRCILAVSRNSGVGYSIGGSAAAEEKPELSSDIIVDAARTGGPNRAHAFRPAHWFKPAG